MKVRTESVDPIETTLQEAQCPWVEVEADGKRQQQQQRPLQQ